MDKPKIIYKSDAMARVLALVEKIARTDAAVIILGKSGTGKDLIARTIHSSSDRSNENFVAVNCAALHESLLESELFGHKKGAYTGANAARIGRFEQANEGTIFLDEIGDMSMSIQAKVLRVIQNRSFERLGSNRTINVNVRIIAATNRNLSDEIMRGTFREDLYYRLAVIVLEIPLLRNRKEDILPLVNFFIIKYSKMLNKKIKKFTPAAIQLLQEYSWCGNVRELENLIHRIVIIIDDEIITDSDLGNIEYNLINQKPLSGESNELKKIERNMIIQALIYNNGKQKSAADLLGISPRVINYKIKKKHNIEPIEYFKKIKKDV